MWEPYGALLIQYFKTLFRISILLLPFHFTEFSLIQASARGVFIIEIQHCHFTPLINAPL